MAIRVMPLLILLAAVVAAPASSGTRGPTADEQLVRHLGAADLSARAALRSLEGESSATANAGVHLGDVLAALRSAGAIAPRAVGALQTPAVRKAVQRGTKLARAARQAIAHRHLGTARLQLQRLRALEGDALRAFGVPLEKEFSAFAVNRKFGNVMGFEDFSGFSAKVGAEIDEVIIGAPTRATANAGESGGRVAQTPGLPITQASAYLVSDPIGQYWSDWCRLSRGLITCRLVRATMHPDEIFSIAFKPKLARGTKVLIKFRAVDGQRSYAVFSIR
jgi:hypothetical protein